jgi:hypothetical protein
MKEHSDVTACVIDRGTFWPVAERLARGFKKVYYHKPNGEEMETFAQAIRGDGHSSVEYLSDFWPHKKEIDLFIFPDCVDGGLQLELQSQGFAVWGSKGAGEIERMRGQWLRICQELGSPMPKTHVLDGLSNLQKFLTRNEGPFFVKISRYRGDMETWKAEDPIDTANYLDYLRLKFGPFKENIRFYVQEPIDTDIEAGADSYFCAGQWPSKIVLGYEKKGQGYFSTWRAKAEMPEEIWQPSEKIAPLLAAAGYCNFVSSEIRVADGESYFLDPCFRFPSPASEEQLELYANLPEIIWHGANGIFTEPEMSAKFCGGAIISFTGQRDAWKSLKVPEELKEKVKLYSCGYLDGYSHFPPKQEPECIGWAISAANTPAAVLDGLREIQEALKNAAVEVHITHLADLFAEIASAEDEGIPFAEQDMPEPAAVIDQ